MSSLPTVSGPEAVAAFKKAGFVLVRIASSHHILKKTGHRDNLFVPCHGAKPLKPGLLRGLIRKAGLTVDEFNALLS